MYIVMHYLEYALVCGEIGKYKLGQIRAADQTPVILLAPIPMML
jgi:hypothetical protein